QAYTQLIQDPNGTLNRRLQALRKLRWSKLPEEHIVKVLIATLNDPNPRMRYGAVEHFYGLGPKAKAAIPALLGLLGDEELEDANQVRDLEYTDAVAHALGGLGLEAAPGLADVLKDPAQKPFARWQAARALSFLRRQAKSALPVLEAALN